MGIFKRGKELVRRLVRGKKKSVATVGELKRALQGFSDDTPIAVRVRWDDDSNDDVFDLHNLSLRKEEKLVSRGDMTSYLSSTWATIVVE